MVAETEILPLDPEWGSDANGIAVDGAGTVYVTDGSDNLIKMYSAEGDFLGAWGGDGLLANPQEIALSGDGYVYVIDGDSHCVRKFTKNGAFVTAWGSYGTANGQFTYPGGIAVDGGGNVYVADYEHRVQKFTSAGQFIAAWGGSGTGNGQFSGAGDIALDDAGYLYITDASNHRVQKFRTTGSFAPTLNTSSPTDGSLGSWPISVAVDGNGILQVLDGNRIKAFQVVVPDFTAQPVSGIAPLAVQFTERSNGMPTSCSWSFGDGVHSTAWNPIHLYEAPGTYMVRHIINSPVWGIKYVEKNITLHPALKAGFTA